MWLKCSTQFIDQRQKKVSTWNFRLWVHIHILYSERIIHDEQLWKLTCSNSPLPRRGLSKKDNDLWERQNYNHESLLTHSLNLFIYFFVFMIGGISTWKISTFHLYPKINKQILKSFKKIFNIYFYAVKALRKYSKMSVILLT